MYKVGVSSHSAIALVRTVLIVILDIKIVSFANFYEHLKQFGCKTDPSSSLCPPSLPVYAHQILATQRTTGQTLLNIRTKAIDLNDDPFSMCSSFKNDPTRPITQANNISPHKILSQKT